MAEHPDPAVGLIYWYGRGKHYEARYVIVSCEKTDPSRSDSEWRMHLIKCDSRKHFRRHTYSPGHYDVTFVDPTDEESTLIAEAALLPHKFSEAPPYADPR